MCSQWTSVNIWVCSWQTKKHRIKGKKRLHVNRLPYVEWFWASSGPLESHLTKKKRRRRKKTHWCIYRKMRPHNTLFGERIIMEPRCSGACVPVFWLTLSKQAGRGMNQGGDTGLTLWNRQPALSRHTHPLLTRTQLEEWCNVECVVLAVWRGAAGFHRGVWEDRLDFRPQAGHLFFEVQNEEVFAKQKGPILVSTEQTELSVSIQRFL